MGQTIQRPTSGPEEPPASSPRAPASRYTSHPGRRRCRQWSTRRRPFRVPPSSRHSCRCVCAFPAEV